MTPHRSTTSAFRMDSTVIAPEHAAPEIVSVCTTVIGQWQQFQLKPIKSYVYYYNAISINLPSARSVVATSSLAPRSAIVRAANQQCDPRWSMRRSSESTHLSVQ